MIRCLPTLWLLACVQTEPGSRELDCYNYEADAWGGELPPDEIPYEGPFFESGALIEGFLTYGNVKEPTQVVMVGDMFTVRYQQDPDGCEAYIRGP